MLNFIKKEWLIIFAVYAVSIFIAINFGYRKGQNDLRQEIQLAELTAYKDAANALLDASSKAQTSLIQIGARHDEFKESYQNLAEFDCYADAERMQHIYKLYTPAVTR